MAGALPPSTPRLSLALLCASCCCALSPAGGKHDYIKFHFGAANDRPDRSPVRVSVVDRNVIPVDRPRAAHVPEPHPVAVAVPYPVYKEKIVRYPVYKQVRVPVEVPYIRPVPYSVYENVPVPYPVEKRVPYPVRVPVHAPAEIGQHDRRRQQPHRQHHAQQYRPQPEKFTHQDAVVDFEGHRQRRQQQQHHFAPDFDTRRGRRHSPI